MGLKTCGTALSFANNFRISWIIYILISNSEKDLITQILK